MIDLGVAYIDLSDSVDSIGYGQDMFNIKRLDFGDL